MCRLHFYPTESLKIYQLQGPASPLRPPTRLCTGPPGGFKAAPTWIPCLILVPPFTSNYGSSPGTKYFKEEFVCVCVWGGGSNLTFCGISIRLMMIKFLICVLIFIEQLLSVENIGF